MFYAELKRGFTKTSFKVGLLIGVVFVFLHVMEWIPSILEFNSKIALDTYLNMRMPGSFDKFMLFGINMPGNIFIVILPLLCSIAYSDSYVEDSSGKVSNFIYVRETREKYAICKYTVNFIMSGITIAIPLILDMIICAMIFPSIKMDRMLGEWEIVEGGLLPNLVYLHPLIYVMLTIFICFLFAGVYSSIALSAGIFIKKKFVVVIIPFIVSMAIVFFTTAMNKEVYNHTQILFGNKAPIHVVIVHFMIILISTFLLFYFGVKKREF